LLKSADKPPESSALGCADVRRGICPTTRVKPLTTFDRVMVALTGMVLLLATWPQLAPTVLFGDGGDLQLACATWGIAHPPGYVGYATVGWLLCKLFFFVDPAYVISVACMVCMIIALLLLMVQLIRLKVHPLLAGSAVLILTWDNSYVWHSLVKPEVYAPSLALLLGSASLLLKYGQSHRRLHLYLAAGLCGFLVINRISALLMVPAFVASWMIIERQWRVDLSRAFRTFSALLVWALIPVLLVLALVWDRDYPNSEYNYINHLAEEVPELNEAGEGWQVKWRRLVWLISAKEYHQFAGANFAKTREKFRWVRRQCYVYDSVPFWSIMTVMVAGTLTLINMGRLEQVVLIWGILLGGLAFVLQYRIYAQAADILPILLTVSWLIVAGLSTAWQRFIDPYPLRIKRITLLLCTIGFIGIAAETLYYASHRYNFATARDTREFMTDLDFESLPANTIICAGWAQAKPLWYAKLVSRRRQDVTIIGTNNIDRWRKCLPLSDHRMILYVGKISLPPGWHLSHWHNVYRPQRDTTSTLRIRR